MRRILLAGATSAIARGFARAAAERGDALFLAGRSEQRLQETADDLRVRGASTVGIYVIDLCDTARHPALLAAAEAEMKGLDMVLIAHGTLTDLPAVENDTDLLEKEIATNFTSAAVLLMHVANKFQKERRGSIGVITSVAGDRGRQSNYAYGSAKAGLIAFTAGLRGRLLTSNVTVTDIRPGFVDTPMTAGIEKKGPLFAQPEPVGRAIYKAVDTGWDVVYLPWFWRFIMMIIKAIPEGIFKRMRI